MKKINLLLAVTALLMFVSCQNAANPTNTGNENNSEKNTEEVFDINKISITPTDEKFVKLISKTSVGQNHYFVLLQTAGHGSYIKYDGEALKINDRINSDYIYTSNLNSNFYDKYMEGTIDYSDPETFNEFVNSKEYEVLDNKIFVYSLPLINVRYLEDYYCEQDDGYFLTLSNGNKKIHYDLDLSVNETYTLNNEGKKLIKKTNIDNPYSVIVDNYYSNFIDYPVYLNDINTDEHIINSENKRTIIDNILSKINAPSEVTYKNYKDKYRKKEIKELFDRYNVYFTGSFYNGLKLKYLSYQDEYDYINKELYMDFEIHSVELFDQYEDLAENRHTVLEYFKMYGPVDWSEQNEWDDYDSVKVSIQPEIEISPFENKVLRLFDLGMYR